MNVCGQVSFTVWMCVVK